MPNQLISLEEKIKDVLKDIYDPEIPVNIYDLGLIYSIEIDESKCNIKIKMTLTSPGCPAAQILPQTVKDYVADIDEVSSVSVEVVWDPPWNEEFMSEIAKIKLNLYK